MSPVLVRLVRHADAVARATWSGPDDDRPLTGKGRRQADALAAALAEPPPARLLTSPARRCADSLAPLAKATGTPLEDDPVLAEGAAPMSALHRLLEVAAVLGDGTGSTGAPVGVVACTHGDVVDGLLHLLAADGVDLRGLGGGPVVLGTPKGARWELLLESGTVRSGRLVGPPPTVRAQ